MPKFEPRQPLFLFPMLQSCIMLCAERSSRLDSRISLPVWNCDFIATLIASDWDCILTALCTIYSRLCFAMDFEQLCIFWPQRYQEVSVVCEVMAFAPSKAYSEAFSLPIGSFP